MSLRILFRSVTLLLLFNNLYPTNQDIINPTTQVQSAIVQPVETIIKEVHVIERPVKHFSFNGKHLALLIAIVFVGAKFNAISTFMKAYVKGGEKYEATKEWIKQKWENFNTVPDVIPSDEERYINAIKNFQMLLEVAQKFPKQNKIISNLQRIILETSDKIYVENILDLRFFDVPISDEHSFFFDFDPSFTFKEPYSGGKINSKPVENFRSENELPLSLAQKIRIGGRGWVSMLLFPYHLSKRLIKKVRS